MFTLYNKAIKKKLTHPVIGVWYAFTIEEAEEMKGNFTKYLEEIGMPDIKNNIVIMELDKNFEDVKIHKKTEVIS